MKTWAATRDQNGVYDTRLTVNSRKTWCSLQTSFWPKLATKNLAKVTESDCRQWAKSHREHFSATRFEAAPGAFKQIFELAISSRIRHTNPASKIKRANKHQTKILADSFIHRWFRIIYCGFAPRLTDAWLTNHYHEEANSFYRYHACFHRWSLWPRMGAEACSRYQSNHYK